MKIVAPQWTDCIHNTQNFEKFRNSKIHYYSIKEHLKLSKIAKLVVKCEKYNPMKFANFVYFCITHRKLIPLSRKWYQFFERNTKRH